MRRLLKPLDRPLALTHEAVEMIRPAALVHHERVLASAPAVAALRHAVREREKDRDAEWREELDVAGVDAHAVRDHIRAAIRADAHRRAVLAVAEHDLRAVPHRRIAR